MASPVYLVKRSLRVKRKNGVPKTRWALRWEDPDTGQWKCETTATADRTEAEGLRREKWAELNGLTPPKRPEPAAVAPGPTWAECAEALRKAMEADKLRPSYVYDSLLAFDLLRRAHAALAGPAEITVDLANAYKRTLADPDKGRSAWSVRGDLATLKAIFGKWLGRELGFLTSNPFANVSVPRCDEPDVRIVTAAETAALMSWLADRWSNWRLPLVYLEVAAIVGWRAMEIASIRTEDILDDGFVRVAAQTSKTRRQKHGKLPAYLHAELKACTADGWAFGRFSDDLRRLLLLAKQAPHHAAKVKDFTPERLVHWLQDELSRFNDEQQTAAEKAGQPVPERFTLHDFRRTAITAMQMAGVSEKEASVQVGATPEVIRRHYEKLDQMAIASRNLERRFGDAAALQFPSVLRARCARPDLEVLDSGSNSTEAVTA